jgi:ABC-type molybdate transport system permease subunit
MAMLKILVVTLALAVVAGIAGLLTFAFLVQRGWWDGPGGGMMIFPLVLMPAFCGGIWGFTLGRKKFQSS